MHPLFRGESNAASRAGYAEGRGPVYSTAAKPPPPIRNASKAAGGYANAFCAGRSTRRGCPSRIPCRSSAIRPGASPSVSFETDAGRAATRRVPSGPPRPSCAGRERPRAVASGRRRSPGLGGIWYNVKEAAPVQAHDRGRGVPIACGNRARASRRRLRGGADAEDERQGGGDRGGSHVGVLHRLRRVGRGCRMGRPDRGRSAPAISDTGRRSWGCSGGSGRSSTVLSRD